MLSLIIPSRTEKFLNNTIQDVLEKATGEIEVFPILDGYEGVEYNPIEDPRVKYIRIPNNGMLQKRQGVNVAASIARGKYLMVLDAHCMVAPGFDEVLAADCDDDWVVVPRRHRLDALNWKLMDVGEKPPIDYEYFMWQKFVKRRFSGYRWDIKTKEKADIPIDDIMTCQGSTWFMTKKHFDRMKFMRIEGYTGWGQEGEEVVMETWLRGGRAVVNKKTWYAHLHKGKTHGRMYSWNKNKKDILKSYEYSYDYWTNQNKNFFIDFINKFMPIPNWKSNWEEIIYGNLGKS